jgi:hypothetical protein
VFAQDPITSMVWATIQSRSEAPVAGIISMPATYRRVPKG